jgi:hypothetical protein
LIIPDHAVGLPVLPALSLCTCHLRDITGKLKLTVNEAKTRICRIPDGTFDFLGYPFGRMYSPETGKARLGYRPSKKSHAYAQCRSNQGAPGVDGQDFADIEAYGVERWLAELDAWTSPIKLHPRWNQGDYYGKAEPIDGLVASFKIVVYEAQNWRGVSKTVDRKWTEEGKDPAKRWENRFLAEQTLDGIATSLAQQNDANSFLYEAKAIQLFVAGDGTSMDSGLAKVKAKLLILPAQSDLMIFPKYSHEAADHLRQLGKSAEYREVPGDGGHIDAIYGIAAAGELIRSFLGQ